MTVEQQLKAYALAVDDRLDQLLPPAGSRPPELAQAVRYSCLGPGKRLRPALCLATCEAVGGTFEQALDAACAIEMVHCFSLIHDDLPALDDDELRRGRPTCHVKFGEALAILAGDALFSLAFQTVTGRVDHAGDGDAGKRLRCVRVLAESTGFDGLVAGETADILAEGAAVDLELLDFIHSRKTGALLRASCEIGAILGTDDETLVARMRAYGSALGLAFQIADDILDETSTREELGKSAGRDKEQQKATYPRLMGIDASRARAFDLVESVLRQLDGLPNQEFLADLARFSVMRSR